MTTFSQNIMLWVFFFVATAARAQDCDYNKLLSEGIGFYSQGNYEAALNKFNAARTCDFSKAAAIDKEISKVFLSIKKQRDEAVIAKKQAELNARAAEEAKIIAEKQTRLAELAKQESERNLRKANSLNKVFNSKDTLELDATRAFLLAYEAVLLDTTKESLEALMNAFYRVHYKYELKTTQKINKFTYSSDYNLLAIALKNGAIVLWNIGTDTVRTLIGNNTLSAIAFIPNSGDLVTAGEDGLIKVWDVKTLKYKYTINLPVATYTGIAFITADTMVTASLDGKVRFFDLKRQRYLEAMEIQVPGFYELSGLVVSPSQDVFGLQSPEGIAVINTGGKILYKKSSPWITSMDFSEEGDHLAVGSTTGELLLYHIPTQEEASFHYQGVNIRCLRFVNDQQLYLAATDGRSFVFDLNHADEMEQYANVWKAHFSPVEHAITNKDERFLITSSEENLRLWHTGDIFGKQQIGINQDNYEIILNNSDAVEWQNKKTGSILRFLDRKLPKSIQPEKGLIKQNLEYSSNGINYRASIYTTALGDIEKVTFEIYYKGALCFLRALSTSEANYLEKLFVSNDENHVLIYLKNFTSKIDQYNFIFTTLQGVPDYKNQIKSILINH